MRIIMRLTAVFTAILLLTAHAHAQAPAKPRSYADVIENDYPAIQLRFGKGAPASLVPGQNRVGLLSGAGFTTEGVDLFGDYTIEWWQMVPNLDRNYPVARIGGRDIGIEPLPKKKDTDPPSGVFTTGDIAERSTTIVYPNKWYHVALVVQGRTTQWYVNGFPDGKLIEQGAKPRGELRLGTDIPGNAKMSDGEVAVYGYAVPPQRIKMHFQSALASRPAKKIVTVGHRGVNKFAPENTRISYVEAVAAHTPIVEMDLALAKDGVLVLMHDKTVDRTTNGKGAIVDLTSDELSKLDAGTKKNAKYAGEPVPTLNAIGDVCRGKAVMMLDLKAEGLGASIQDWLTKSQIPRDQVIMAPWTDEEGTAVRKHVPDVAMIRLTSKIPAERFDKAYFDRMKSIGFSAFSVNWQYLSQSFVDAAHKNGMGVYVWTVNDNPDVAGSVLLGVDGVITDDPASTMKTVASLTPAAAPSDGSPSASSK
jgi:glycerophosphoryl diester phosphodiesterase